MEKGLLVTHKCTRRGRRMLPLSSKCKIIFEFQVLLKDKMCLQNIPPHLT